MVNIVSFYCFVPIIEPQEACTRLARLGQKEGILGTLVLAPEGVNGTIAGPRSGVDAMLQMLRCITGGEAVNPVRCRASHAPFRRLKVRVRHEIISLPGVCLADASRTGEHVDPAHWNSLMAREDVAVIDTRNEYEVAIGTFPGAINPRTGSFREFPLWWHQNRKQFAGKTVAMFCTGGIRCEKSSRFLRAEGVQDLYQLKGGILAYLSAVPQGLSRWQGACFVFDERVAVDSALAAGSHALCFACRGPISEADRKHPEYVEGIACPRCAARTSARQKARFAERHRQSCRAHAT